MNKKELVAEVKKAAKLGDYEAENAVSAMFDHITNALARGEQVSLIGFGSFKLQDRAARTARHPQTGAAINVAASRAVRFRAGQSLRHAVSESN
jgi:nucleoid DNA-binding protein